MQEIDLRYQVDLRVEVAIGNKRAPGRSQDLSLRGIGAYVPCELEIGQYVDMLVRIPFKQEDLRFGAIVRNRKGYRYGFEFSTLQRPHQEFLEEICATLSNLSSLDPISAFQA